MPIFVIFTIVLLSLSFYLRINFWPFVQTFGLYQGDLWYFYYHYGEVIKNNFFYPIEYPVGFVLIQKLTFFLSEMIFRELTYENFIFSNALLIIPAAVATVILIGKLAKVIGTHRKIAIWYLLASPTFFIASTTNYDFLATFLVLLSVALLLKHKMNLSFFFLSLGTALKIFPGFLLPLFVLFLLFQKKSWQTIFVPVLIFFSTLVLINLPFALLNFSDWIFPYLWQIQNPQRYDPNTVSYFLGRIGLEDYRTVFFISATIFGWVISFLFYHHRKLSPKNFILLAYFICLSAVFANHVNAPQYLLWFLPFAAIAQLPIFGVWWIFDLINSTVLFSYFKLSYEFMTIKQIIFTVMVIYFSLLYLFLIYHLKRRLDKT